jgi:plastocyanin
VTWTFGSVPHDVTFNTPGAPQDIPLLDNGSASRDFPANGTFQYHCSIHSGMNGSVRVH